MARAARTANENLRHWAAMSRPPETALKKIGGGRLRGMTDISPMWRYEIMTQQFGPCGIGWKYQIEKVWTEPGADGEVMVFALVVVFVKDGDGWSDGVPGIGGNHLIAKETSGLRANDEAYKMAITDALSVSLKMLGVGADVYGGKFDGSKYIEPPMQPLKVETPEPRKRIELPPGTVQLLLITETEWGADVLVVDSNGEEQTHKTTDRQCAELALELIQEKKPVTLTFTEITRGTNKGKLKLTGIHRYPPEEEPPPPVPEQPLESDVGF